MEGGMEEAGLHAAASPQGCESPPHTAARCSLSVYIMNSQQRRDRRAMNSWLKYQNTAAQVSQSIFRPCMTNTFSGVTNRSQAKLQIVKLHDDASDLRDTRILLWKWFHAFRYAASTSRHFRCNRGFYWISAELLCCLALLQAQSIFRFKLAV